MNILTLSNKIDLQEEIKAQVLEFSSTFDFDRVNELLASFQQYERMPDVLKELQDILGDDSNGIKILTCQLKASSNIHQLYQSKGISDDIYFATMKCYTRFINETYKITGKMCFDRFWWTTRQAGFHLFRIDALEYEMRPDNGNIIIDIHVPSDADFSPSSVDESINKARLFFKEYFPELSITMYQCHSWLLDKQLRGMLKENSNILSFQNRFEIYDDGEIDKGVLDWLFNTRSSDYKSLPENTSLQRNVKKHLLSGGVIRSSSGRLI